MKLLPTTMVVVAAASGPLKGTEHQRQPARVCREWRVKADLEQSVGPFSKHLLPALWEQSFLAVKPIKKHVALFLSKAKYSSTNTMKTANLATWPPYAYLGEAFIEFQTLALILTDWPAFYGHFLNCSPSQQTCEGEKGSLQSLANHWTLLQNLRS